MSLIWDIRILVIIGVAVKILCIFPIVPSDRVDSLNEAGTLLIGAAIGILQEKSDSKSKAELSMEG